MLKKPGVFSLYREILKSKLKKNWTHAISVLFNFGVISAEYCFMGTLGLWGFYRLWGLIFCIYKDACSSIKYACEIFPKTQGVRNVGFWGNFAYVLNGWSLIDLIAVMLAE